MTTVTSPEAASGRVAAYLRDAILNGEIAPGEWIRQAELADRLGASRLPVREALRMLQAEGLTDYEANRGSRVPKLAMRVLGLINPMMRGLAEMSYQFDEPFILDTTRYQTTFGPAGTPLAAAVAATVAWYRTRAR